MPDSKEEKVSSFRKTLVAALLVPEVGGSEPEVRTARLIYPRRRDRFLVGS